jgi:hypothetical protein
MSNAWDYAKGWLKYSFNHANHAINGTGVTTGQLKHIVFSICVEAEWAAWVGRQTLNNIIEFIPIVKETDPRRIFHR